MNQEFQWFKQLPPVQKAGAGCCGCWVVLFVLAFLVDMARVTLGADVAATPSPVATVATRATSSPAASPRPTSKPKPSPIAAKPIPKPPPLPKNMPTHTPKSESLSIEQKLAVIEMGDPAAAENTTLVGFFGFYLESIEYKTVNSKQEIADVAVHSCELLKQKGVEKTPLEMLRSLDTVILDIDGKKFDVAVAARALVDITQPEEEDP